MGADEPAEAAQLIGPWFHSHEEDSPGVVVYRPASFAFPRARMPRDSITLGPDGSAAVGQPGPADRADQTPATWHVAGNQVVVDTEGGRTLRLTVGELDQTVLIMRSVQREGRDDDEHTME
ncbi:MAG: hypothetical protein GX555_07800 [Actinomycetales bacterium]|nr:hypothetical protein [Actinomycetales bacterium]